MAEEGTPIGALAVRIGADASDLIAGLGKADKALSSTGEKFAKMAKQGALFTGALAGVAASVFAAVDSIATMEDELGKMGQRLGLSVESMSALKYAADISNVGLQDLATGLRNLSKNMQEAQSGSGQARDAFRALGVEFQLSNGQLRLTEDMLLELVDKFSVMKDGLGKTALAVKVFGKSGDELIPFLNQGRAGIKQLMDEAQKLGIVISGESAQAANEFKDNLTRLKAASESLAIQISGPLIQALGDAAGKMVEAKKAGDGFFGTMAAGIRSILIGSDETQLAKQIVEATDAWMNAEEQAKNARQQLAAAGNTPFDVEQVKKFEAEAKRAKAELDSLIEIQKQGIMAPRQQGAQKPQQTKEAPTLPDAGEQNREAQRAREAFEAQQKANQEYTELMLTFYGGQVEAEKKFRDDQLQVLMDAEDRRQAAEIAAGAALIEADSLAQSFKLAQIQDSYTAQALIEQKEYERRLRELENFSDAELETIGGRQRVEQQMEQAHQDRMHQIRQRSGNQTVAMMEALRDGDLANATSTLEQMTSGLSTKSREMFEINKAAAEANVIVTGIKATMEAFAWGTSQGGYWVGIAMAGLAAGFAAAQLAAVSSASYGSGVAPSVGATAAPPVTPVGGSGSGSSTAGPSTFITLNGDSFSKKAVRDLLNRLGDGQKDGGRLVVS